jgi:S-adenosylmethionine hydrolase
MKHSIVTFLSDFGTRDPYAAEIKAVVLSTCPDAKIIDISHEIKKSTFAWAPTLLQLQRPISLKEQHT